MLSRRTTSQSANRANSGSASVACSGRKTSRAVRMGCAVLRAAIVALPIMSARHRALELDAVAFGVVQVDRRTLAFGAVARRLRTAGDAVGAEMLGDRARVERLHAQAEMVEIGAAVAEVPSAGPASLAGTMSISVRPARSCASVPWRFSNAQPSTSM